MAEVAVGFLLQSLGSFLQQEASRLRGLHSNFTKIQLKLERMRAFLKDADRRKGGDEGVKTWVDQVRDVCHEVDDLIDKYTYYTAMRQGGIGKVTGAPKMLEIAKELEAVESKIQSIEEDKNTYCFQEEGSTPPRTMDDGESWLRSGEYTRLLPDHEIVGIDRNKEILIGRLTDERQELVVLPVFGMGGLGKSTLVTKVYNSSEVKNHFYCFALITVSQSYKVDELFRSMIKKLYKSGKEAEAEPDGVSTMERGDLVNTILNYLQGRRYVIVLDDVWDNNVWEQIRVALPNNGCGSRIMVTTREENVALSFGAENALHLQHLSDNDAWRLFCIKAFSDKTCPRELVPYADRMVQKCEGLPLAIVTIGGLMLTKGKLPSEWRRIEGNLNWQLRNNKELERMKNILLLSYNDLPYNLKHCFLYCSLFPEDFLIPQKRLARLLVAEDFVKECGRASLEEVAVVCIKELICRSLLQSCGG